MERKKTSLLIIGVCALVLSMIGLTYAFWQLRLSQTDENNLTSSCFDVSLINEGKAIQLTKAYPMEDKEGEQLEAYTFTIKNNCKANAKYQINLESLIKLNSGEDVTERLDEKYLKVKLNEVGKDGSIQELTESNRVSPTIIEGQTEGNARSDKAYKLTTGYLEPEKEKQYELRLWLDGDLTMEDTEAMNKTYASKITVIATYTKEAKKSLVDTILAEGIKADDSGETGLYKVTHEDASITYTNDPFYQERLKQDEYRYAGFNPNNYVAVGDKYTTDIYTVYGDLVSYFIKFSVAATTYDNALKSIEYIEFYVNSLNININTNLSIPKISLVQNEDGYYIAEMEQNGEISGVAFSTKEECESMTSSASEYGTQIITSCTQPEEYYEVKLFAPYSENEYTTQSECLEEKEYLENNEEGDFSCEIFHHAGDPIASWRIIGLVNTPEGQRIKLVKGKPIGNYAWDTSSEDVNEGLGVNEWSEADLMKLLNPGYDDNSGQICTYDKSNFEINCNETNELVNNSLYWNGKNGICYSGQNNTTVSCDFTNDKMPESLKEMIDTVTWNTGAGDIRNDTIPFLALYEVERSNNIGKMANQAKYDDVLRTTSWKGKVGLIYPSDYAYATSGEKESEGNRTSCFEKELYDWDENGYPQCANNDWLKPNFSLEVFNKLFTLSPYADNWVTGSVYIVSDMGNVDHDNGVGVADEYSPDQVLPAVYLKPAVFVTQGNGSQESPYVLEY